MNYDYLILDATQIFGDIILMLLQINDVADVIIIFGKQLSGSRVGIVIEKKEAKPKIRTV